MDEQPARDLTVREAGKLGGQLVLAKYGRGYYSRLGKASAKAKKTAARLKARQTQRDQHKIGEAP